MSNAPDIIEFAQGVPTTAVTTGPPRESTADDARMISSLVFFGVMAVIVLGALILYLRNRRPRGG